MMCIFWELDQQNFDYFRDTTEHMSWLNRPWKMAMDMKIDIVLLGDRRKLGSDSIGKSKHTNLSKFERTCWTRTCTDLHIAFVWDPWTSHYRINLHKFCLVNYHTFQQDMKKHRDCLLKVHKNSKDIKEHKDFVQYLHMYHQDISIHRDSLLIQLLLMWDLNIKPNNFVSQHPQKVEEWLKDNFRHRSGLLDLRNMGKDIA